MKTNKNLFNLEEFSADKRKSMFIEASAGTGKTYTITGIVENLVKNAKIPLEKILIVTYTEKAVGELKDRIRSRLTNIPDCHADVDNAPIYTIHSFCQKTLDEFAFTAEQPFSLSLVNESEIGDFIDRWIRDNLATNAEFEKLYSSAEKASSLIRKLKKDLSSAVDKYYLKLNSEEDKEIISLDDQHCTEINGQLISYEEFNKIASPDCIEDMFALQGFEEVWNDLLANRSALKAAEFIQEIENNIKNSHKFTFNGRVFQVNRLGSEIKEDFLYLKSVKELKLEVTDKSRAEEFFTHVLKDLYLAWQEEKSKNKQQSYNDMIRNVREAVCNEGLELKKKLQEKYTYAIIDEFQDTNKRQWDIFSRVFMEDDQHTIIVVGDPKQSIYSFQGADVNVYQEAIQQIAQLSPEGAYSLATNWRSTDLMVQACNALFEDKGDVKFFESLKEGDSSPSLFTPSNSSGKIQNALFDNHEIKPFWIAQSQSGEKIDENSFARIAVKKIVECCTFTSENKTRLQVYNKDAKTYRNVSFHDFAVLGRTGSELEAIEEEMRKAGVPYSRYKDTGLFNGLECAHWIALLNAIAANNFSGHNRRVLNEALYTKFFNVPLSQIKDEKYDSPACEERQELISWQHLASQKQWAKLLEAIFKDTKLEENLSRLESLTSLSKFHQIGNYIVEYLYKSDCSLEEMSKKLSRLSNDEEESSDDESIIAKMTDFDCVQLMTIHASKGLEFPVVIGVAGFKQKNHNIPNAFIFHEDGKAKLNFSDYGKTRSDKEENRERERLFYVAYTRASALMILPNYTKWDASDEKNIYGFLDANFQKFMKDDENTKFWESICLKEDEDPDSAEKELKNQVQKILNQTEKKEERENPEEKNAQQKELAGFAKIIPGLLLRKHSYVSLSHGQKEELTGDSAGRLDKEAQPSEQASLTAFDLSDKLITCAYNPSLLPQVLAPAYPKGTKLGLAVHEVFEAADFIHAGSFENLNEALEDIQVQNLVDSCFEKQSFIIDEKDSQKWRAQTLSFLWNTLNARLPVITGGKQLEEDFQLKELSADSRIAEAEFNLNPDQNALLKNYCNGFIDLIFMRKVGENEVYSVLDWKSDSLEDEDYSQAEKLKNHTDEKYAIQRVLYSYALVHWLNQFYSEESLQETFEKHFGGIYYVYIRGCRSGCANGIFAHTWESWTQLEERFNGIYKKLIKAGR